MLVDYRLTSWSPTDGLSTDAIWAIEQDARGYLWLGTDAGLIRFDGVRFVRWSSFGTEQLPKTSIRALRVTRDGSLWIGFGGSGGLSRVTAGQVRHYHDEDGMPTTAVATLVEDPTGTVWAGTSVGLFRFTGQSWEKWQNGLGLPAGPIFSAFVDRQGALFVGTSSALFRRPAGS